jgi:hypothetical protein
MVKLELEDIYAELSDCCCSLPDGDFDLLDERRCELEAQLQALERELPAERLTDSTGWEDLP